MKKGKILPVSILLSCCCLEAFAGTHGSSAETISKNLIAPMVKTTTSKTLEAQQSNGDVKVNGTVVDDAGEPVIGATIRVKDNKTGVNGTTTDIDGKFILSVPKGATLQISYIGMATQEVKVTGTGDLNIALKPESHTIDQVVVTALGIKRSEKALSYNVQKVGADQLTNVKNVNFVNSLNGAVAGVNINASTTGVGGPTRVVMRGTKSITGGNNVLYVIDGVPMLNKNGGDIGGGRYSSQPSGEGIADINPDDIESINVLTGPSSAALYGSAAANGVIMINTKRGTEGKVKVAVSSSLEFSNPFIMPKFQNTYGNKAGSFYSWGDRLATPTSFQPKDFFNTGHNFINSLTLTTGTKTNKTYISVATTNATGILPNNEYNRYNFTVRNTSDFLNDKLHLDINGSYIIQNTQNMYRPGEYYNPLTSVYLFPRGNDWSAVELYKRYDASRKLATQYWPYGDQGMQLQNPYFIVNDMMTPVQRKRYMFMSSLKYDILSWLNVTGRVRVDNTNSESESRFHASGQGLLYAGTHGNGIYNHSQGSDQQTYLDVMFNLDKSFGKDYRLTANVGASLEDYRSSSVGFGGPILKVPNLFSSAALDPINTRATDSEFRKRNTAIFASAELSWKDMLYLSMTGRNDWSSLLVHAKEPSFFYPSVGLSAIVTKMAKLPEFVSFMKVRGSYTEVGSPIPDRYRGVTRGTITYPIVDGIPSTRTILPFYDFKAERTRSFELGLDLRMFENKLNFDLTWYHSNTYNQTFLAELSATSPYTGMYIQAGDIANSGVEMSLAYNNNFGGVDFESRLIYSRNVNKVKKLVHNYHTGIDGKVINFTETSAGGGYIREGDSMGDVYITKVLKRDATGAIAVGADGSLSSMDLPNGERLRIGNTNPDFNMGWRNSVSWKGLNLSFLINARFGGIVTSATQAVLDQFGVSQATADARDRGYVEVAGGVKVDPQKYYEVVANQQLMGYYYYNATNVRLQNISLSYTLPRTLLGQGWPSVTIGFIANNLWMIYNKAPFDPEIASSTGTYGQGSDYFSAPSLRNLGFSLKLNF
ncbi:SusC/RagA family TonB-linked outer membrane protein [Prevotella salivae]|uniref:SusC/RagA family TonB-linked outer membrane protein n=1 Tax=Segatella salivae TaxID=228604 RepID=UPI001C604410|nr:SusC/RagA family TonB-linked outer membrane protein [Segatella salivae]MBW4906195.1 SusC/RagA family TonB-linked outer membrane protein [Segatella salivae]